MSPTDTINFDEEDAARRPSPPPRHTPSPSPPPPRRTPSPPPPPPRRTPSPPPPPPPRRTPTPPQRTPSPTPGDDVAINVEEYAPPARRGRGRPKKILVPGNQKKKAEPDTVTGEEGPPTKRRKVDPKVPKPMQVTETRTRSKRWVSLVFLHHALLIEISRIAEKEAPKTGRVGRSRR